MSGEIILRSKIPPFETPLISVGEIVWKKLQELSEDSICLVDARSDEKLTIKELKTLANSIAIALVNRGITKSDRICCSGDNSIQYAVLQFAAYFLGITLIPLGPTLNIFELRNEIQKSGPTIIFSSTKKVRDFDSVVTCSNNNVRIKIFVVFDGTHDKYLSYEQLSEEGKDKTLDKIPYFDVDPKKDSFILTYSSGTTGIPKCAILSHYVVVSIIVESSRTQNISRLTVACSLPFGHASGSVALPVWVVSGNTVVLFGEYDEELILKSIERYRINVLPIFPTLGRKLIEGELVDKYDLSSVKLTFTAGAAFPGYIAKAIIEKYKVLFLEGYAMTEYLGISGSRDFGSEFTPGNLGRVSVNTELKIVDINTGKSLGPNTDGEICVRGPKMFSGYLNNEEETKNTIDSDGWLHTGDIGHYDQNECLFITDRIKEIMKYRGCTISPVEIEQFLLTHESVAEVAVVGVKHNTDTQWPRAYVKVKEGKNVTEEDLKKFVADTMAYTKQLRAGIVFVDEIPKTSIGKVDRKYFKNLIKNELIE